jgi:hypothetical protein
MPRYAGRFDFYVDCFSDLDYCLLLSSSLMRAARS